MARIRSATNRDLVALSAGWHFAEAPVRADWSSTPTLDPAATRAEPDFRPAAVPGTVAGALRALGAFSLDKPQSFDDADYWYRTSFGVAPLAPGETLWLRFDGLATLADVWLNGQHVLRSDNMFVAHELEITALARADNRLELRFCSLGAEVTRKRPRPRFKTRLIDAQQLRWFRTTLLGRMPGWSPPVAAVGPWRPVLLERRRDFSVTACSVRAELVAGSGRARAELTLQSQGARVTAASLHVGSTSCPLRLQAEGEQCKLAGELALPDVARWWPHGHGEQARYSTRIVLVTTAGEHVLELDPLAFRSLAVEDPERFELCVNGVGLRCRGACWAPTDVVSLNDDPSTLATLQQARAAGMNMLRVGGTMLYESDAFYEACDRLGILVWQDLMFANCDYPAHDPEFSRSVSLEVSQFLQRTAARACLAVLCGGSEVEQQIAMLGLPREAWKPALFEQLLRQLCQAARPDVPYVPSSPSGGALPFQANAGVSHYYGVGAYLRPLEDARRADVQFAAECLAFANVPEPSTLALLLGDVKAPFHEPLWKARVPRDNGAGWDFDDVRDHYVRLLFDVDPLLLRYQDPERALELARVATGEVMARTLAEWRRAASSCRGALIWLLRDLWPGAGWGLIDALGTPKAAYYYVKRAMQPLGVFFSDEGLNGLSIEIVNDSPRPLAAELELVLWRAGQVQVAAGRRELQLEARSASSVAGQTLLEHFIDLTHAYRFGPAAYDVATVRLLERGDGHCLAQDCYFPGRLPHARGEELGLEAFAEPLAGGGYQLRVTSARFAQSVAVQLPQFLPEDSYFHLAPGQTRMLALEPRVDGAKPTGVVHALNARSATRVLLRSSEPAGDRDA